MAGSDGLIPLDELILKAYWRVVIAPGLGWIPGDALAKMQADYLRDALANPKAVEQAREWLRGYP